VNIHAATLGYADRMNASRRQNRPPKPWARLAITLQVERPCTPDREAMQAALITAALGLSRTPRRHGQLMLLTSTAPIPTAAGTYHQCQLSNALIVGQRGSGAS